MNGKPVMRIFLPLITLLLWSASPLYAWEQDRLALQYPRVDHSVYSYLSRFETSGDLPLLSQTKPYLQFIRHPVRLEANAPLDREFRRYAGESTANQFVIGRSRITHDPSPWRSVRRWLGLRDSQLRWLYGSGDHFATWTYDTTFAVGIQPVYGLEAIQTDVDRGTIGRFAGGIRIEGGYAGRIHFMMDFRDHTETGNGPYWSRSQLYEDRWAAVDLKGNSATSYDISESFIQYYGRDLSLTAGRGRFRWGPSQFGSLFLNSQMPPFDYLRFDAVLESADHPHAVNYTFIHGWLESQIPADTLYINPDGRPRTINSQKYLSAQRLEVRPRANLLLGLSQGVIYGDRGVQLAYLTPVNFLYSVQHSQDDKDNFLLSLDGTWRPINGLKIYGEFLFDDIVVGDLTTSSGNNKSAYTVGVQSRIPGGCTRMFDATLEYTKIRPFVYSHFFTSNIYTHWTSPIGYTREPNSEFMTARLRWTLYPVQVSLLAARQNHGMNRDNQNVGGDIEVPNYLGNDVAFPFLAGKLIRTTRIGIAMEYEVLPNLQLICQGQLVKKNAEKSRFETQFGFGWNL